MSRRWIIGCVCVIALSIGCATDRPLSGSADDDAGPTIDVGFDSDEAADSTLDLSEEVDGDQPDSEFPECTDGDTQEVVCGLNGRGIALETCIDGAWSAPEECDDPDRCTDGETDTVSCGRNDRGTLERTCTEGAWTDDTDCEDPDECTDGEMRTVACGLNDSGSQDQTCVAGEWDDSGECVGEDPCTDGMARVISCGLNDRGLLPQDCVAGTWEDADSCDDPDECVDGTTQSLSCGLNDRGTQEQTCTTGAWADVGDCDDPDECVDGATQSLACGFNDNGTQDQNCVTGSWQDDGACDDPDECVNGDTRQIDCGFDGSQEQTCTSGGWVDAGDCVEHTVGYCLTQPAMLTTVTEQPSPTIEGTVYVDPKTPGAGAASGVVGEVVYGPAGTAPSSWTDVEAASYVGDVDGLTPGDLANDLWNATITESVDGDYEYAFRFSADGGATWQLCDVNGTDDGNFDDTAVGFLEVTPPEFPDACHLQFPQLVESGEVGQAIEFYGRVTEVGVTGMGSAAPDVVGELLVGPVGDDPRPDATGFQTIAATHNAAALNLGPDEDEYSATFTPAAEGEYAFGFRFSVDGGANWSFCGLDDPDADDAFDPVKLGWLHASASAPTVIDFCHVWQDTLNDDADTTTLPDVTVEVFHAGTTDSGAPPSDIEAEAAAIPLAHNPAIASVSWNAVPYKGPRPGVPQNYEYEGTPYTSASHPAAGLYNVVVRVRRAGDALWTYCDTDDTSMDFRLEAATRLEISP